VTSVVSILVTARSATAGAFATLGRQLRSSSAASQRAAQQMRADYAAAARQVADVGQQLQRARQHQHDLSSEAARARGEMQRLEDTVRRLGPAASDQLRNQLHDARVAAHRAQAALHGADRDANALARSLQHATDQAQGLARALDRAYRARRSPLGRVSAVVRSGVSTAADALGSVAQGAAGGLAALAPRIGALGALVPVATGALASLLPLIQLIAPAAVTGGAAMTTLAMATHGVADAFEAGLKGKKFDEAIRKLAPSAQDAVRVAVRLTREWRGLQSVVQDRFFKGAGMDLYQLNAAVRPLADVWLPRIADNFARARHEVAQLIVEAAKAGQLESIFRNVSVFIGTILDTIRPLGQAFLDVAEVAAPRLAGIGEDIQGMAQRFADWIREMKESGKLGEWLDEAIENAKQLVGIGGDLLSIFGAFFSASRDEGAGMLENLHELTTAAAEFFNSAEGQQWINNAATIGEALTNLATVFNAVISAGRAFNEFFDQVTRGWVIIFANAVGAILNLAAKAFSWVPGLGPMLQRAADEFGQFRDQVNGVINGIQREVYVTVTATLNDRTGLGAGRIRERMSGRASGGLATGLTWVGERGRELVDFGAHTARVHSHGESERMAAGMGGGRGQTMAPQVELVSSGGGDGVADLIMKLVLDGRLKLRVVGTRVVA
jgi:hypothetical protein